MVIFIFWILSIPLEQKKTWFHKSMWYYLYRSWSWMCSKVKKIDGCRKNPENSSTTKLIEHIPSDFSMSAISWFRSIENKHDV